MAFVQWEEPQRNSKAIHKIWDDFVRKNINSLEWTFRISTKWKEAFGPLKFYWQEAGQENYSGANKCYISGKRRMAWGMESRVKETFFWAFISNPRTSKIFFPTRFQNCYGPMTYFLGPHFSHFWIRIFTAVILSVPPLYVHAGDM